MSEADFPVTIGGRHYRFDPARYFAVTEESRPAESMIAPDHERMRQIVAQLTGPSGAHREV